jgi:3'-phosphoadenosine 5'-phosphosulfate sulfotransferase (PAPS reductase)/FAD synthetase
MLEETRESIALLQRAPLPDKIAMSTRLIKEWDEYWQGDVSVSFSGGLDSTVLLHLARRILGDELPAYFVDTGLEYPSIKQFVRSTPNVITIRPKLSFRQVLEKYGYPVISKKIAQYIKEARSAKRQGNTDSATYVLRTTGVIKSSGKKSPMGMIPRKWQFLIDAPFDISDNCCKALKVRPLREAPHPYTGVRLEESRQRLNSHLVLQSRGMFEGQGYTMRSPRSTPLYAWTDQDIHEYIDVFDVDYADVYKGDNPADRTGCMFCLFGIHMEGTPNRFQTMQTTLPKLWAYCMDDLGLREVLEYIGVPWRNEQ